MSIELSINNLLPILPSTRLEERRVSICNKTYVGIDFGTSTTVVSIAVLGQGDKPLEVNPIELNQKLFDGVIYSSYKIPTVIAWYNNNLLVGEGAAQLKFKLRQGKNLWQSFKMELGEDVGCKYPNSELGKNHKISILNPKDATNIFFKYLKVQIERYVEKNLLPLDIQYAVSIPASFEANQRKDLIESLTSNGMMLDKQALIDEPNAAFLSYVSKPGVDNTYLQLIKDYHSNILVFDFGAGTCDISILEVGQDNNGVYSKNIAISKFEKLGGNDLDKLIAVDILLPQLLKGSGIAIEDFRTRELKELIIPKLLASAERLKIKVSEKISLQTSTKDLLEIEQSNESVSLGNTIEIETRKGVLTLNDPELSYKDFFNINHSFTIDNNIFITKRIENEIQFTSIFTPINSALKKANLESDAIDYIVFVGGSSKNPIIQKAVADHFSEADALIPKDLQAHVSSGAAIHSLIYNGFGKNIINPITSEPIMLIIKDTDRNKGKVFPIIEAGTHIPSDIIKIDGLTPQKEGQKTIELPICVGGKNKLLYNIKLRNFDSSGFSLSTPVSLEMLISADKMLVIKAIAGNEKIMVEPINPFSNKEMTTEERIRFEAEKQFNEELADNNGKPTKNSLRNLYEAYKNSGMEFKAAETLEQLEELFPRTESLNNIGLHYSNAGKRDKALAFYKKSLRDSPSATTAFNIAMQYRYTNKSKYKKYLKKAYEIDASNNVTLYCLGSVYRDEGKEGDGLKLQNKAFKAWKQRFEANHLSDWEYGWFSSCAQAVGEFEYADYIEERKPKEKNDSIYNIENLSKLKTTTELAI